MAIATKATRGAVAGNGWTNAANATADDGVNYATAAPAKNSSTTGDWDFAAFTDGEIPAGSTINSVVIRSNYKVSTNASIASLGVQAGNNGSFDGEETGTSEPLADLDFDVTFNSAPAEADLKTAGRIVARVRGIRGNDNDAVTISLDYIELRVDYTVPASSFTVTASLGGLLQKQAVLRTAALNALLQKAGVTRSAALDALLQRTGLLGSAVLDGLIVRRSLLDAALDALLKQEDVTRASVLTALLQRQGLTRAASLDSVLVMHVTNDALLDALLQASVTRAAGLDALLKRAGVTRSAAVDALLARLDVARAASLDALLQRQRTLGAALDAIVTDAGSEARAVALTALLLKQGVLRAALLDALIQRQGLTRTAGLDALLQRLGRTASAGLDALLAKQGLARSAALDALLRAEVTRAVALGALLRKDGVTRSALLDAVLSEPPPPGDYAGARNVLWSAGRVREIASAPIRVIYGTKRTRELH